MLSDKPKEKRKAVTVRGANNGGATVSEDEGTKNDEKWKPEGEKLLKDVSC